MRLDRNRGFGSVLYLRHMRLRLIQHGAIQHVNLFMVLTREVLGPKQRLERDAELTTHNAVEDEVDRAVNEREDVHERAQLDVAAGEETFPEHDGEEAEDPLRELRDEE